MYLVVGAAVVTVVGALVGVPAYIYGKRYYAKQAREKEMLEPIIPSEPGEINDGDSANYYVAMPNSEQEIEMAKRKNAGIVETLRRHLTRSSDVSTADPDTTAPVLSPSVEHSDSPSTNYATFDDEHEAPNPTTITSPSSASASSSSLSTADSSERASILITNASGDVTTEKQQQQQQQQQHEKEQEQNKPIEKSSHDAANTTPSDSGQYVPPSPAQKF